MNLSWLLPDLIGCSSCKIMIFLSIPILGICLSIVRGKSFIMILHIMLQFSVKIARMRMGRQFYFCKPIQTWKLALRVHFIAFWVPGLSLCDTWSVFKMLGLTQNENSWISKWKPEWEPTKTRLISDTCPTLVLISCLNIGLLTWKLLGSRALSIRQGDPLLNESMKGKGICLNFFSHLY